MSKIYTIDTQSTRIVIVEAPKPEKGPIELLLDEINPAWKDGPLFSWQWDIHERRELSFPNVYGDRLKGFESYESESGTVVIVKRKKIWFRNRGLFLVDNGYDSFRNILTNVNPYSNAEYTQRNSERKTTLDRLREDNLQLSENDSLKLSW